MIGNILISFALFADSLRALREKKGTSRKDCRDHAGKAVPLG